MGLSGFENIDDVGNLSNKLEKIFDRFIAKMRLNDRSNPAHSKTIEAALNISGTEVRTLVNYARRMNYPIASNQKGYWWAKSFEELEDTLKHLEQRENAIKNVRMGLMKAFDNQIKLF